MFENMSREHVKKIRKTAHYAVVSLSLQLSLSLTIFVFSHITILLVSICFAYKLEIGKDKFSKYDFSILKFDLL